VVCSNREARKRPAESNATPAMDLGHMNVVLKLFMCMLVVDLGIVFIIIVIIIIIMMFCLDLFFVFPHPIFFPPQLFLFLFRLWSSLNVWLRWMCCGGGVACYAECTNMVNKW